jgi:hypothetical protein
VSTHTVLMSGSGRRYHLTDDGRLYCHDGPLSFLAAWVDAQGQLRKWELCAVGQRTEALIALARLLPRAKAEGG